MAGNHNQEGPARLQPHQNITRHEVLVRGGETGRWSPVNMSLNHVVSMIQFATPMIQLLQIYDCSSYRRAKGPMFICLWFMVKCLYYRRYSTSRRSRLLTEEPSIALLRWGYLRYEKLHFKLSINVFGKHLLQNHAVS